MTEHWERSRVYGVDDEKMQHREDVLHRRGEDALVMAVRRNPGLAGCSRITVDTVEVFTQIRQDRGTRRDRADIPCADNRQEEWDW